MIISFIFTIIAALLLIYKIKELDIRIREQDEEIYKLKQQVEELDYRTRR